MPGYLPQFPLAPNPLVLFGLLLLAGAAGGDALRRATGAPRIVGYLLVGLLLGPGGLALLAGERLDEAWVFADIGLGLIVFELGRRLDPGWLAREPWLAATAALECLLSFAALYWTLGYFGVEPLYAAVAAAIGIATSPAALLVVARELGAEGQVTERALHLAAINSVVAFVALTMLLAGIHHEYRAGWLTVLLHPVYLLAGSAIAGYAAGVALLVAARLLGKSERGHFVAALALVVLAVGAARMLELSVVLALLAFGVLSRRLDERHDLMPFELGRVGELFVVVLFVASGASLKPEALLPGAGLAAAYVLARFAGKSAAVMALTYFSGVRRGAAGLLCLALTPMAAVSIAMVRGTSELYPEFGERLGAIVLPAILVLGLLGPLAAAFALRRAGEAAEPR